MRPNNQGMAKPGLKRRLLALLMCFLSTQTFESRSCRSAFIFRRIPPLEQELGSSPTLSKLTGQENYYFDPLKLATDQDFAKYRESELKHGRVAMLATIGMLVPALVPSDHDEKFSLTAVQVIQSLELSQYVQVLGTCAFLEAFVFVQQDVKDMPGDYGTGYFGLRDKGRNERSLVAELENGRLAMLAFVIQLISELVANKNIVEQWETFLSSTLQKQS